MKARAKRTPAVYLEKKLHCGAKTKGGSKCQRVVTKRGQRCPNHRPVDVILHLRSKIEDWRKRMVAPLGQWHDVRSETRIDVVHHIYTGDLVNSPHCTCEDFRYWGTMQENVLHTCKHIDLIVFGKGVS